MAEIFRKEFGDGVKFYYVDVIEDDLEEYPEIEKYLTANNMKLPLVTINGTPFPGLSVAYKDIAGELEKLGISLKNI